MTVARVVTSQIFLGMSLYGSAPTGLVRQTYAAIFTAVSQTPPPYTFSVSGTLPPTVTYTTTSNSITFSSNNLTTDGTYIVTLSVRDSNRVRASITIIFIIVSSEPDTAIIDELGDLFVDEAGIFWVYA